MIVRLVAIAVLFGPLFLAAAVMDVAARIRNRKGD